ncbi:hypothetical protein AMELA_G00231870 [Ameiurus melas]|uniref:BTB/POZ domain-containing protein n=1 Tax=Ameiurus melas TaxID=219545 RepID=A0A7J5ZX69_AMEME|nr:hypothetical protein AMELA_G00231870 [Ameiurus melas]
MKPDGVATTPAEPADDVVESVPEAAGNEEQVQQDLTPSPQPEKLDNVGGQEGANSTMPPPEKEVNGKFSKPKDKTKAPVKTKPATAGTKASTTTGTASRPATAQNQVANGVMKKASNGASKKLVSMSSEMKKSAPVRASTQVKKEPIATVPPRTQVKAAERKAVGSVPSTSSGTRKMAAATTLSTLSKKPVTGGSNAAVKPKTTVAPRPPTAPAAKTSVSAASKAAPIPKTTRPTVAAASCPTTSSVPIRPTTTASKSTALRKNVSAPSAADSSQPSKVSTTVAAKKDIKTTIGAAARKPLASTTTRTTATKASKPEPPKPGTAAKRSYTDTKTSKPKTDETRQVPTRKVPSSSRNTSRLASGSNHKQGISSNLVSVKRQTAKPTHTLPLVIKGKPSEEQSSEPVEPSAILEATAFVTTAAIAPVESVMEAQTPSVERAQPDQQTSALVEGQGEGVQVPASQTTNVDTVSTEETIDVGPLAMQSVANVPVLMSNLPTVVPESEKVHDYVSVVIPMAQKMTEQELVTASLCEVSITAQVPTKDLEVVEKQEEEEEREGSQQVSLSDMSGTQPTEESRPGSAGLAGSVWQAGGLPSEFDSEDVSCSQQGASELSAPGVLEGTESMDDLGEASLKGADEVASAGSPDFEKFPDIPVNEDDEDDDDDRVDYMEVGSEMTEDPFRQCNDNEDEDEDVEMASEAVTESGLESYGNADEDDFAEDYRLDNLNSMQPSSIVPTALSAANPFADAWMQSLQPEPLVASPSSNPWQVYSQLPIQPTVQACLDIGSAKTDPSSQSLAVIDPDPSSPKPSSEPAAEMDMGLKQGSASHSQHISQSSTLLDPELAIHTCSDSSTPEELKDYSISTGLENQKQPLTVSLIPASLPDIMQDLRICRSDHAGSEHEEDEPETLPADDMLVQKSSQLTDQPSLHSSATGDEASDSEGDLQLGDPTEPGSTGNECFDSTQGVHSMSALVEECEEACVEMEGGGGSDAPQSATSAASNGFECTISNSNASSTTESCIKCPGIFSLKNEEQLPEESKDASPIKELDLAPASTYSQLPNQLADESSLDIGSAKTDLSSPQSPVLMDPDPSSPLPSSEPAAEMDMGLKQGLASHSQHISQSSTLLDPELAIHTCSGSSTCQELKDYCISPAIENQKPPLTVSLVPVSLPDIMQDLGICGSDHAGSEHEEDEPETLPADDMMVQKSSQLTDQPSLHSSATGDEASDSEGDLQLSDPTEPGSTGNECFDGTQVVHSMSALVEECEEACVEIEGGGGSDTPQSATSAASYGFECTTSNSNALSTTESCIKSPGIFSLENEEQLPEESKDASLIKELNLAPANDPADVVQQGESQLNSEGQYMLCGKGTEELPEPCSPRGTVANERGLDNSSHSEHQQDLDRDSPHHYYSTISEKTDSFLTGSNICVLQQEKVPTVHATRPSKHYSGLRVDHVTRLPTDLPPRMTNPGCNTQLRRLEQHQQQLEEIEQRREQQSRRAVRQMEEREEKNQVAGELEQKNREKNETELEVQRTDLLHQQIQQQQQELKQRQQVMQWQQELEQQKQNKHQNSHQKNVAAVLSPSGLCTIYEALEISDAEEDFEDNVEEREILLKVKVEHKCSPKERSSIPGSSSDNPDSPQSTLPFPNLIQDHEGQTCSVALDSPPLSGSSSPQQPSPLELDWSKKADIVQQLINQTLLLNGDNCSPLLLLPGGAAGTLSPLETSLWPSLPTLTPPSATVTSVSSFSAEISGSSPQGEWTVVELETHH